MYDKAKSFHQPGDPIRASDLNAAAKLANRGGNLMKGNNANGAVMDDFQGLSAKAPCAIMIVRIVNDVIPDNNHESNLNNTDILNGVRQLWDDVANAWGDDPDCYVTVGASKLPLLKGTVLPVTFHRGSGRWAPLDEPCEGIVEILSTTKNSAGFYDGTLEEPDLLNKNFKRVRPVHVLDGNDPTWPSV